MKTFGKIVGAIISGVSLGILIGLSNSPVLNIVISSILTLILAFCSFSLKLDKTEIKVEYVLVPFLLLSITIGAIGGIYIRVNNIGGLDPDIIEKKWKTMDFNKTGWEKNIRKRLFDNVYPLNNSDSNSNSNPYQVILNRGTENFCNKIRNAIDKGDTNYLINTLKLHEDTLVKTFAKNNQNNYSNLKTIAVCLCGEK